MKPLRKRVRKPKEADLVRDVIKPWLFEQGYKIVVKTHGNRYQKRGLPDLYCYRPYVCADYEHCGACMKSDNGYHRWLEAKRPGGKLEESQVRLFEEWESVGLPVEIVTVIDGKVVISPWREWLK